MVVICTIEVGRSKHAALGSDAHLPADLHRLLAGRAIGFLSAGRAIGNEPLGAKTRSKKRLAALPAARPSFPRTHFVSKVYRPHLSKIGSPRPARAP